MKRGLQLPVSRTTKALVAGGGLTAFPEAGRVSNIGAEPPKACGGGRGIWLGSMRDE